MSDIDTERDRLIVDNFHLVGSVARHLGASHRDLDSMESDGTYALVRAAEDYLKKGRRGAFGPFARQRIKWAMVRSRAECRLPLHVPTNLIWGPDDRQGLSEAAKVARAPVRRDGEAVRLADLVADDGEGAGPRDCPGLGEAMKGLTEAESEAIRESYGLDGRIGGTDREVAARIGTTRVAIRTARRRGIEKLKASLTGEPTMNGPSNGRLNGHVIPAAGAPKVGRNGHRKTTEYVGVSKSSPNRYGARYSNTPLGNFDSAEEAARARDDYALAKLGDKATLNFPRDGSTKDVPAKKPPAGPARTTGGRDVLAEAEAIGRIAEILARFDGTARDRILDFLDSPG